MLGNMELVIIGSAIAVIISIAWAVTKIKGSNVSGKNHAKNNYNGKKNGTKIKDLQRRERELKNKENSVADKQRVIKQQEKILAEKESELKKLTDEENKKLSTISGLSRDKAKKNLMNNLKRQLVTEIREQKERLEREAKETIDKEISSLIEESLRKNNETPNSDILFSVYMLPRAEIKSWVIGSSGRNIRTFESASGAKLVISQFSDAVIISSREQKKLKVVEVALDELIAYGKITPELIIDKIAHLKDEYIEFFGESN
ncbi:MAG: DUF3552 domain-containing protein [Candidatus Marinimicrobia bacterium]|nr:DUF3552 domain-containing protein [Candidatus Neomarinimicrobiota bacterium]